MSILQVLLGLSCGCLSRGLHTKINHDDDDDDDLFQITK
jgi:hypothetical protein